MPPLFKVVIEPPAEAFGPEDTHTYSPDASPETTSVDGRALRQFAGTWAQLIAGAGTAANDSGGSESILIQSRSTVNSWLILYRTILLFDTSDIPAGSEIVSAFLKVYGANKTDLLVIAPSTNVYSSSPASNTAVVAADYQACGSTPFCDTPISYAAWDTAGWNTWTLNAAGLAAIAAAGITKLSLRNANYDVAAVAPAWSNTLQSYVGWRSADAPGRVNIPILSVTFKPPL